MLLRLVFFLSLMICSSAALADSSVSLNGHSINGLTDSQAAQLQVEATKLAEQNRTGNVDNTIEEFSKIAEISKSIGVGLASTAREMGIAVNEFADTPVGKIVTVLIVAKLIGFKIFSAMVGLLWMVTLVPLWIYFFRRLCMYDSVRINYPDVGRKTKEIKYITNASDEIMATRVIMMIILAVILVAGLMILM